jgi:hypothetical protein
MDMARTGSGSCPVPGLDFSGSSACVTFLAKLPYVSLPSAGTMDHSGCVWSTVRKRYHIDFLLVEAGKIFTPCIFRLPPYTASLTRDHMGLY